VCVDDHPSIRENLRYLLNADPDLEVVAVAGDATSAIRVVRALRPDVLVIDYDMPDLDGLTVVRILRRQRIKARIVLYTAESGVSTLASRSGVDVCVRKDDPPEALVNTVRVLGRLGSHAETRVLIVEDDPAVRQVMRLALEEAKNEVVEAADGREALAVCERQPPGVVVLDLGLPEMNGRDFARAYRRLQGENAPIVVVSAASGARQIAQEIRAAAFVPKPFSVEELSEAVLRATPP
jgi:CheY-like chemotaxis protein